MLYIYLYIIFKKSAAVFIKMKNILCLSHSNNGTVNNDESRIVQDKHK